MDLAVATTRPTPWSSLDRCSHCPPMRCRRPATKAAGVTCAGPRVSSAVCSHDKASRAKAASSCCLLRRLPNPSQIRVGTPDLAAGTPDMVEEAPDPPPPC